MVTTKMSSGLSVKEVLVLYRNLLKYGQQLKLTDKDYFSRRIRKEFKTHKNINNPEQIEFLYKKGVSLLEKRRIL